jgi:TRAP-type C4-dicarboxylate transport system permease small subunit
LYATLCKLENSVCIIGLYATTLLIFIQVVNRFVLHIGVVWILDLALYLYMAFVFVASAVATRDRGHVAVDAFYQRWFRNRRVGMARYALALSLLAIAAAVTFIDPAWQFLLKSLRYPQYSALVPGFNTSWLKVVFSCSFALVVLHLVINAWRDFVVARDTRESSGEVK